MRLNLIRSRLLRVMSLLWFCSEWTASRKRSNLLKQVVQAEPKNSDALTNLGMALAQVHEATNGIPFLKRAIALNPNDAIAHQDLAAAYIQVNQIDDAVGELKTAIKLAPDSPQLHYDLGTAYKLQDNAVDAIPELETAERLNPSGYEPAYVLGLLYMQVARYAEGGPTTGDFAQAASAEWRGLGDARERLQQA